jgi:hypothetical protein
MGAAAAPTPAAPPASSSGGQDASFSVAEDRVTVNLNTLKS